MSYEEIDKSVYGTDVFTNGAKGRYAKAEPIAETTPKTGEKKKRAPKAPSTAAAESAEQPADNGNTDDVVKTKKKSRKVRENDEVHDDAEVTQSALAADGEASAKPKKKKTPKAAPNIENIDPVPTAETEPVKKKKSKAPKLPAAEADFEMAENSAMDGLEPSGEPIPKVKKTKKHKTPKTTDATDGAPYENSNEFAYSGLNDGSGNEGVYGSTTGDLSYDFPPPYPGTDEPLPGEPEKSDYEMSITNAYNDLAGKLNFAMYVGEDEWSVKRLPKSARGEPKSRIRKILPAGKEEKANGKASAVKPPNPKSRLLNRFRSGMSTLVRDEGNLLFGDQPKYEMNYYDEEDDGVDTDDLHRYAQKLRELEDTDREVNPEFLVLRDGKTVYAVHEADAEGKITLSTRKPIYDRYRDQAPDDEPAEKKKLLDRLKNPFGRNKDKDGKGSNSPKPSNSGTPDPSGKRKGRKTTNKTTDDDIANSEPLVD